MARLGRGVDALFTDLKIDQQGVLEVPVAEIRPNPEQPRKTFDEAGLRELAQSITSVGIVQPLVVERIGDASSGAAADSGKHRYTIIAGERRYRAAQIAGKETVPVLCRAPGESERLEIALIENIQRSNLNAVEEARAYQALLEKTSVSHEDLATRVGKGRSTITNMLRILNLPGSILKQVQDGGLTFGHARALLGVDGKDRQLRLAGEIVAKGLSVRQTEMRTGGSAGGGGAGGDDAGAGPGAAPAGARAGSGHAPAADHQDDELRGLEEELTQELLTRVRINGTAKRGTIVLEYHSLGDLNRLVDTIRP